MKSFDNSEKKELVTEFSLSLTTGKGGGPSLSTLLGYWSIGLGIFNKEYSDYIDQLPDYYKSIINVSYYVDRTLTLIYDFYSLGYLFRLCSYRITKKVKGPGGFILKELKVINLKHFLIIVFLKFDELSEYVLKQAYGSLYSMQIVLINA